MDYLTKKQAMVIKYPIERATSINPHFSMALAAASVRTRQNLQELIQVHLRRLVTFDEIYIRTVDKSSNTHDPYLYYSQIIKKHSGIADSAHAIYDGFFDVTLSSDSAVIWDLTEVSSWPVVPRFAAYLNNNNLKSAIGIAITSGNTQLGAVFFCFTEKSDFSCQEINLFQEVTKEIGTALTSILELESTTNAIKEKDQLLALGEAIAAIRNRESFDHVVSQLLKKAVNFNDLVVLTIDRVRNTQRPYIMHFESQQNVSNKRTGQMNFETCFLEDSVINYLLLSAGPLVWSKSDMEKWDKIPRYLKLNPTLNVGSIVGVPLIDHKLAVGVIFFLSEDENAFSGPDLLKINAICRRLSIAILNIAASEEIQRHKEEKEQLLSFSKSLATVRDRKQFSLVLKNELTKLSFHEGAALYYLKVGGQYSPPIVTNSGVNGIFQPDWYATNSISFTKHDPLVTFLQQQKKAVDVDLSRIEELNEIPDYVEYWLQKGIKSFIAAPLFNGVDMIAVMFFLSNSKYNSLKPQLNLISEIACQISIVATHVNTNEKIIRHFEEISKSKQQLEVENLYLQEEIYTAYNYSEIIGSSNAMKNVFYLVSQVANANSTVLILGETGTGKELIARALHNTSSRKDKVMVKINCATLPANLIESELFGHEKGSFTGATERRIGKFEMANNSTLFLDEIGELPLELQGKLLRALQEKEIERIGGRSTIKTDVRIIAATNRDLQKEVQAGTFRSDLYFRLNVFPILIPPLRDRKEDVAPLASHFLIKYAKKGNSGPVHFSGNAIKQMIAYNWPGNVRELEHLIERSVLLANGKTIQQVYLPDFEDEKVPLINQNLKTIDDVEREHILAILKMTKGKISGIGGAAEILRIPATTLTSKIRRLKIKKGVY